MIRFRYSRALACATAIEDNSMGNGLCEGPPWATLPGSLLLTVFKFLSCKELVCISSVCTRWMRVARDERIWKR
ncbi:unnamed protein product [Soboliphyme baturini]|uniref:F-box domain-containing protein n=1 Tax=Soboliphyme baturini TaxID=241478 RepID=A0A183IV87_9BILA|nr:unnamed protein product [Soboliphyme baturini]